MLLSLNGILSRLVVSGPSSAPTVSKNLAVTPCILLIFPCEVPSFAPASSLRVLTKLVNPNPMCTFVADLSSVIEPPDTVLSACAEPSARICTVSPSR